MSLCERYFIKLTKFYQFKSADAKQSSRGREYIRVKNIFKCPEKIVS